MKYSASLDGIRGLAAIGIVAFHAGLPGFIGGFFAVDIFFVLSGYLITSLLIEEKNRTGSVNLLEFMERRLRRLWPALLLMLVVYLTFSPWLWSSFSFLKHLRDAIWTGLYIINWSPSFGELIAVLGHVWSLAIEMQFYLVWPVLFVFFVRLPRKFALFSLLGLYFLVTGWRFWGAHNLDEPWSAYLRTDMHCTGLILGAVVAFSHIKLDEKYAFVGSLLLLFSMTFYSTYWAPTVAYGFTIAEFAAALLVLSKPCWLGGSVLAWFGKISYGMYLWHYPIMHYVKEQSEANWLVVLLIGFSLAVAISSLSYYFIERRFYRARYV